MKSKTARSVTSTIRLRADNLAAIKLVAALTGRTASSMIEHASELYIRKNYPEAYIPGAKLQLSLAEAPTK